MVNENLHPQIVSKIYRLPNALLVSMAPEALLAGHGAHTGLRSSAGTLTFCRHLVITRHWLTCLLSNFIAVAYQWQSPCWWEGRGNEWSCCQKTTPWSIVGSTCETVAGAHRDWGKVNLPQPVIHLWFVYPWLKSAGWLREWQVTSQTGNQGCIVAKGGKRSGVRKALRGWSLLITDHEMLYVYLV